MVLHLHTAATESLALMLFSGDQNKTMKHLPYKLNKLSKSWTYGDHLFEQKRV